MYQQLCMSGLNRYIFGYYVFMFALRGVICLLDMLMLSALVPRDIFSCDMWIYIDVSWKAAT